ncbi:MAG: hypothetical protein COB98_03760 [Flavobacteriaceae bacterium]|nr:MAG: hypothetical protein COB98_03760 [Flavobacteriaceae bacterium]
MKNIVLISVLWIFISCGGGSKGGSKGGDKPSNTPPSVPGLIYPESNMLCIDNVITFKWKASEDFEGDALKYEIQVSDDSNFSSLLHAVELTGVSKTFSLDKGAIYYWRVRAIDATNASSNFSVSYQFYTEGIAAINYVPFLPILVKPMLNQVLITQNVTLEWEASDVDVDDTLTYDVYFGESSTPGLVVAAHPNKNYTQAVLSSKTYYWRIEVRDSAGAKSIGKTWLFKTD